MSFTNTGLVEHAKKALALKTKYMWAGTLNLITDAYINQKVKQCKDGGVPASRTGYTDARIRTLREYAGKNYYGVDCVCLVKSYLWGGIGCPNYKAAYDLPAGSMYERAKVKGPIKTMPDTPGIIVYSKTHPHVGIYIGNGETIESTLGARGDGVVKHKLDDFWEFWFECPFIEYVKTADAKSDFKVGDKVMIKGSAELYAGSSIKIPSAYKGRMKYTIDKLMSDRARLQEIWSWVYLKDLTK
ncbi:MAG: C40 family peptidase [Ruminococcus sp.]|nr:C40 family peptidase [Ruminiclostridium sp.]MBP1537912.1 C40 family peptidase [Ruminococcus sp.]